MDGLKKTDSFKERLLLYRRTIHQYRFAMLPYIFSNDLAKKCQIHPAQIRHDFLKMNISGNHKLGYSIEELLSAIDNSLNIINDLLRIAILGSRDIALLLKNFFEINYPNFQIDAVFLMENDCSKYPFDDLKYFAITDITRFIGKNSFDLFVISNVPDASQLIRTIIETGVGKIINLGTEKILSDEIEIINLDLLLQIEKIISCK